MGNGAVAERKGTSLEPDSSLKVIRQKKERREQNKLLLSLKRRTEMPSGVREIIQYLKTEWKRDKYDLYSAFVLDKVNLQVSLHKEEFSLKDAAAAFHRKDGKTDLCPCNLRCANFFMKKPKRFSKHWKNDRLVFIEEQLRLENGKLAFVSVGFNPSSGELELMLLPVTSPFKDHYVIPFFENT